MYILVTSKDDVYFYFSVLFLLHTTLDKSEASLLLILSLLYYYRNKTPKQWSVSVLACRSDFHAIWIVNAICTTYLVKLIPLYVQWLFPACRHISLPLSFSLSVSLFLCFSFISFSLFDYSSRSPYSTIVLTMEAVYDFTAHEYEHAPRVSPPYCRFCYRSHRRMAGLPLWRLVIICY